MNGSIDEVVAALRAGTSFVLTSHARPDGDAIGSTVALAIALDHLGKQARVVLKDPIPAPYLTFPEISRVERAGAVSGPADAVVLLECSDLTRPEIAGLDNYPVVNIDHHLGNAMYGRANWFDVSAAACAEMVAAIVDALGVPWTMAIASNLYLGISTDTGGLRYGPISARTFELCRRIAEAGVDTAALSRQIFDSFSVGRVRLMGALLNSMTLHHHDQFAILSLDDDLLAKCGATIDDTEGLVNLPLGASEVVAAALFKRQESGAFRVSLRSKGAVDVRSVASAWHGGGHRNAAGCTVTGAFPDIAAAFVKAVGQAIDAAAGPRHLS